MKKIRDIETALLNFEEAAKKQAEATDQGDFKTGNKNYAEIVKAITFLKEHDSMDKLSALLSHSYVGVRLWAASFLLPFIETEALRVLKEISSGSGIHSLTAETTLSEWEKGTLKL